MHGMLTPEHVSCKTDRNSEIITSEYPENQASAHALIYNTGRDPETCYFVGERKRGMTKKPIQVQATHGDVRLPRESRIHFSKIHAIECDVEVKDLGLVVQQDLAALVSHVQESDDLLQTDADEYTRIS